MSSQSSTPAKLNGLELEEAFLVVVKSIETDDNDKQQHEQHKWQQPQQQREQLSPSCSAVVIGIFLTEAMQTFAFYGSQIILVLYLTQSLEYSEASSIALFSFCFSFADVTPIIRAILADGWWGRSKTIRFFGTVAVVGLVITSLGASSHLWNNNNNLNASRSVDIMFWRKFLSFTGLILMFAGIGNIDPCLSSFGADQVVGTSSSSSASTDTPTQQQESNVDSSSCKELVDLQHGSNTYCKEIGSLTSNNDNNLTAEPDFATEEQQQVRVRAYFAYLYFCTTAGAVVACGLVPLVREYEGFGMAFFVCAICASIGLACFMSQCKKFHTITTSIDSSSSTTLASTFTLCAKIIVHRLHQTVSKWSMCRSELAQPLWNEAASSASTSKRQQLQQTQQPSPPPPNTNISSVLASGTVCGSDCNKSSSTSSTKPKAVKKDRPGSTKTCRGFYGSCNGDGLLNGECCNCSCDTAKGEADTQSVRDAKQALRVVPIMAMLPVFWMLYDQQQSVWILQASHMSLHGLQPEQLSFVNPIQIMIFIPLFDRYVYPTLTRYGGIKLDPLSRMGVGMVLAACAFVVSGVVEIAIQRAATHGNDPPSVLWQLIQITLMAVSEILVSITGLEFSYSAAPARIKAFLMAVYSLTKAFGDLLGGLLYSAVFRDWDRSTVMYVCAFVMILNRLVFDQVARDWYNASSSSSLTTTTTTMETNDVSNKRVDVTGAATKTKTIHQSSNFSEPSDLGDSSAFHKYHESDFT